MKIIIEHVEPIMSRKFHSQFIIFNVASWFVKGKYLDDPDACECGAIPFETYVNRKLSEKIYTPRDSTQQNAIEHQNQLSITETELKQLIEQKLKNGTTH